MKIKNSFTLILNYVSDYFDIPKEDIIGKSRKKDIIRARFIVIFLARDILKLSYLEIGKRLGDRDHSSILSAYKKVTDVKHKERYSFQIEQIKENIKYFPNIILRDRKKNKVTEKSIKFQNNKNQVSDLKVKKEHLVSRFFEYSDKKAKKFNRILELWKVGKTLELISKDYKITRQRVQQLIEKAILYEIYLIQKEKGIQIDPKEYYKNEKRLRKEITENKKNSRRKIFKIPKLKRWSLNYDSCINCHSIINKHRSSGYCIKCYFKSDIFKDIGKSWRIRNAEKLYKDQREYQKKYKIRPEVIERNKRQNDERNFGGNREKAILRDNSMCQVCGLSREENQKLFNRDLYVVHLDKKSNELNDLLTLCKKCSNKRTIELMKKNKIK